VKLGRPRLHMREIGSTNDRARELAAAGAPHGTLVTAGAQTAGRGRQGRTWTAPPRTSLLLSLVLRESDALLPLRAGLAVADVAGAHATVKWPNDVLVGGRKVAGILAEARPQEGWTVLGIGLNVALDVRVLPPELRELAGTLGRSPRELEPTLTELLQALDAWLAEGVPAVVAALRERDALLERRLEWTGGAGVGAGVDDAGALLVRLDDGSVVALDAGEVRVRAAE
jgi:BirA family transcriptional regulator, biotin operon repressor / biotin---[acetyl-CoA-carboxylase] ligase